MCTIHTLLRGVHVWVPECVWESGCVCVCAEYSPWQTTVAYLIIMASALSLSINVISICWRRLFDSPIALTVNSGRRLQRMYVPGKGVAFCFPYSLRSFFFCQLAFLITSLPFFFDSPKRLHELGLWFNYCWLLSQVLTDDIFRMKFIKK